MPTSNGFWGAPAKGNSQPPKGTARLSPAAPTGKVTTIPIPRNATRGSQRPTRTTVTHASPGLTADDLIYQREANAIGPDVLKKAANPRVAGLSTVLGDVTGIPSAVDAVRSHNALGIATNAAMFFPFGRLGRAAKGVVDAGKALEDTGKAEGAIKAVVQKGPPPTVKTLGETAIEGLKGSRAARATEAKMISEEKAARIKDYGRQAQADPTLAGHKAAKSALKGKYSKVHFGGFEDFNQQTLDAMSKHITDHPDLREFDKVRAKDALLKISGGAKPTKSEEKVLRLAFGHVTTGELMKSVSGFRALAYDAANIPRSVMASYDASGLLRQGLLMGTGHPVIFAKSVPKYLKAIKSEDFYNEGITRLHERPNAENGVYERMGLELTELTPRGSAAAREEGFRSPLAEKLFPGVRASGRGFMLGLDNARADLADYMYAKAVKQGRDVNDSHLLESIGDVVNSMSGRGDLTTFAGKTSTGAIGRSQEGLNLLLFSPRLIKSRIDFINPFWYKGLDPLARHEAYRAMGGLVVLMTTALTIAKAAGAPVNLDPRSSDFAKIKIGNTRLDLAGGFQQYMRLLTEIATQSTVNSSGVVTKMSQEGPGKTSMWDVTFRFLRSKLAPLMSAAVDLQQRQNAVGQPLTWQNQVLSRITPLSGQDAVSVGTDAAKHGIGAGIAAGVGAFGLSALGGGVQNYTPKQPKSTGGTTNFYDNGSSGGTSFWGK